jgi:hypothetical protein
MSDIKLLMRIHKLEERINNLLNILQEKKIFNSRDVDRVKKQIKDEQKD